MKRIYAILCMLVSVTGAALAQPYPNRPITWIVSTTAGASTDLLARVLGQQLSDAMKTTVVVENKGGANGQIAIAATASAPPDGYTFLVATGAALSINSALYPTHGQVAITKLAPVSWMTNHNLVVSARPSLNVRNLAELIEWAKKNPGKLNVATTALGSAAYFTAMLFKQAAAIDFVIVPHNGGGLAIASVLGDHTDVIIETLSLSRPYIESGKLVALATAGAQRSTFLPNTPTMKELGLEDCVTMGWSAIVAPKETPPEFIARVQSELTKISKRPDIVKKLDEMSAEPVFNTPEAFAREWREDREIWSRIVKKTGAKVD